MQTSREKTYTSLRTSQKLKFNYKALSNSGEMELNSSIEKTSDSQLGTLANNLNQVNIAITSRHDSNIFNKNGKLSIFKSSAVKSPYYFKQ